MKKGRTKSTKTRSHSLLEVVISSSEHMVVGSHYLHEPAGVGPAAELVPVQVIFPALGAGEDVVSRKDPRESNLGGRGDPLQRGRRNHVADSRRYRVRRGCQIAARRGFLTNRRTVTVEVCQIGESIYTARKGVWASARLKDLSRF